MYTGLMNTTLSKIKRIINQIKGLFSSPLPVGMAAFDTWAQSIADTYALPTTDATSIKFTLASIIIHLPPTADSKPKYYFVKMIRAASAKQIAGQAFYEI